MTTATLDAIVHRHHPDPTEHGRVCRSCGRPWPCDVRVLVDAIGRSPAVPTLRPIRRPDPARTRVLV
ncbi:MAG TPA: hypothetical protein VFJ71_14420 [Candidatus Limnocylindrales bacterium]|nr:hypothetical protein [Candidatus Limnocylindrales bacterium]